MTQKGGKREGSGRKPGTSQTAKTYRIDNDLAEWMDGHVGNKNHYINTILRADISCRIGMVEKLNEELKT